MSQSDEFLEPQSKPEGSPTLVPGHWQSVKGENHGLNSQPGDVWVPEGEKLGKGLTLSEYEQLWKDMRKEGIGLTLGQETMIKRRHGL